MTIFYTFFKNATKRKHIQEHSEKPISKEDDRERYGNWNASICGGDCVVPDSYYEGDSDDDDANSNDDMCDDDGETDVFCWRLRCLYK